jgi:hypothetical protein
LQPFSSSVTPFAVEGSLRGAGASGPILKGGFEIRCIHQGLTPADDCGKPAEAPW